MAMKRADERSRTADLLSVGCPQGVEGKDEVPTMEVISK
jgi:hypothetical protein